jgi:hypothetical protein
MEIKKILIIFVMENFIERLIGTYIWCRKNLSALKLYQNK